MFSWCFLSVSRYFSIVRNLCWEPHFWTENRIFKNFSKSLKTCFVGVFWVFQCIFLALFDIWAENRIFEPRTRFSRNSWKASKHVLLVFSGCFMFLFSIVRHLSREPDFWAENQIFKKFLKSLKTCLVGVFWVFHVFVEHCSTSEPRIRFLSREQCFQNMFLKASKHV